LKFEFFLYLFLFIFIPIIIFPIEFGVNMRERDEKYYSKHPKEGPHPII
jgi:hypothetical protein